MKTLKLFAFFGLLILFNSCENENEFATGQISDVEVQETSDVDFQKRQRLWDFFPFWGDNFCNDDNEITIAFTDNHCFDGHIYQAAFEAAVTMINELNLEAELVFVRGANADIIVYCFEDVERCRAGITGFVAPDGIQIALNISSFYENCPGCEGQELPDLCQATFIVAHELLHALGLEHSDNIGATHITGTPFFDPESIVNEGNAYPNWCDLDCQLSDGDISALELLYGCPEEPSLILGPDNILVGEEAQYCINYECFSFVDWSGHSSIDEADENCVTFVRCDVGTSLIYAEVTIGDCNYLFSKEINVIPYNIVDNLEVEFDPCLDIINIHGNDPVSTVYTWGEFTGLNNTPHVAITGERNNKVELRVLYGPGETLCFTVQTQNSCGTRSTPCEVCYTTPACDETTEPIILRPTNLCSRGDCPEGFTCNDGICCEDPIISNEVCFPACEEGYVCINGKCVKFNGKRCKKDGDCPDGFICENGKCVDIR